MVDLILHYWSKKRPIKVTKKIIVNKIKLKEPSVNKYKPNSSNGITTGLPKIKEEKSFKVGKSSKHKNNIRFKYKKKLKLVAKETLRVGSISTTYTKSTVIALT